MYDTLLHTADTVGMIGVVLILIAYYLLSVGRMASATICYQLLNLVGAWLILYSLYFHWNLSSVVIEIAWIVISLIGIYRIVANKKCTK